MEAQLMVATPLFHYASPGHLDFVIVMVCLRLVDETFPQKGAYSMKKLSPNDTIKVETLRPFVLDGQLACDSMHMPRHCNMTPPLALTQALGHPPRRPALLTAHQTPHSPSTHPTAQHGSDLALLPLHPTTTASTSTHTPSYAQDHGFSLATPVPETAQDRW